MKRSTAGSMDLRNGVGATPITKIITTSGVNTAISRPVRSGRLRLASRVIGPNISRWNM
jgi:hypothetical protein